MNEQNTNQQDINITESCFVFIYKPSPQKFSFKMETSEEINILSFHLSDDHVYCFSCSWDTTPTFNSNDGKLIVKEISFVIHIFKNSSCSSSEVGTISGNLSNNAFYAYDTSSYNITTKVLSPLFFIIPALYVRSPQYNKQTEAALTLFEIYQDWKLILFNNFQASDSNIISFLKMFRTKQPPYLSVGIAIVAVCLNCPIDSHTEPMPNPFFQRVLHNKIEGLTKYLSHRLLKYIPIFFSNIAFFETVKTKRKTKDAFSRAHSFLCYTVGDAMAGFFTMAAASPFQNYDISDIFRPITSKVRHYTENETVDLFNIMYKEDVVGQSLFASAIAASLTPIMCSRVLALSQKFAESPPSVIFNYNLLSKIITVRLRDSSIDFSSAGYFQALRPLIMDKEQFFQPFITSFFLPFRHLSNFLKCFHVPPTYSVDMAIASLENEPDDHLLFIHSLGDVIVLLPVESRLKIIRNFFQACHTNFFPIGQQLREQCQKAIWKTIIDPFKSPFFQGNDGDYKMNSLFNIDMRSQYAIKSINPSEKLSLESTNGSLVATSEEFGEGTIHALFGDLLLEAIETSCLTLGVGYFSHVEFPENEGLSRVIQKCMRSALSKIQMTPKGIGRDYINVLSALKSDFLLHTETEKIYSLVQTIRKLTRSITQKIPEPNQLGKERLFNLDRLANFALGKIKELSQQSMEQNAPEDY